MAKRVTIAQLQAQIADLQAELALARAAVPAKAPAPAQAKTPAVYPRVTRYTDRIGRVWEKTQHSANRASTKLVADPNTPPAPEMEMDRMVMEQSEAAEAGFAGYMDDDIPF